MQQISRTIGGTLLVSGTCIGAGMLGLPVSTAAGGFYPTLFLFLVCWAFMTITALLMLEVSLWFEGDINLISMVRSSLGSWGEWFTWLIYVLFLYSLMAAYTAGGGGIVADLLVQLGVPRTVSTIFYVVLFGILVYAGAYWVDMVNRGVMLGLFAAYLALSYSVAANLHLNIVHEGYPQYLIFTLPLLVTSFGFHLLIPSLKSYLNRQVNALRFSIVMGSLIALGVYLVWEWMILGTIPLRGEKGLLWILYHGDPAVEISKSLQWITGVTWVSMLAKAFSFFAILSSFVGVALGLFDFFADGFKIKKNHRGRFYLSVLTFLPPLLFAIFYPTGFLLALSYAGVFAAILLIILPSLLVLVGRYYRGFSGYRVIGGYQLPIFTLLFGVAVIIVQFLKQFGYLPMPSL